MSKKEIQEKLEKIWQELDEIQETNYAQKHEDFINEIGEAMGYVDNAIDCLGK